MNIYRRFAIPGLIWMLWQCDCTNTLCAATSLRVVLVGDSTVTDQAGWGAGFQELMTAPSECINLARGGRSSRSYRAEGWWKKCIDLAPDYVLIQFGHNDQPGKGPARESDADTDFRDHLRKYVDEAKAIGAKPVLVTSLTRRRWASDGTIEPSLTEYAEATRIVAVETGVPLLDLNRLSIQQCNQIGPEAFRAFEPMTERGADHTHLNLEGSRFMGRVVARELVRVVPELSNAFSPSQPGDTPRIRPPHRGTSAGLQLAETDATITISTKGTIVLVYNKRSPSVPEGIDPTYRRSGFLHPVASPAGKVVTATFPFDHPHQHGIFSAWVRTKWNNREIDFWNLAGGTGRVLHQRVVSTFSNDGATGFEVDLVHRAVQDPVVDILRERWKISVYPTDGTYHCFDMETKQTGLTKEPLLVNEYHYGGIALRGPVRWLQKEPNGDASNGDDRREPSDFLNNHGAERRKGNHEHAKWVSLTGTLDSNPVSITVLCHAENFRAPQAARLHPSKPYFCFAPCVDGEFVIDKDHPVHGRYRFLITDAAPNADWLNQQWDSWCMPNN